MGKGLLVGIILLFVSAAAFLYFANSRAAEESLLTESKDKLTKIEIILEPGSSPIKLTIDARKELNKIYDTIKNSSELRVNRAPEHIESMQSDSRFDIVLFYQSAKADYIKSTETGETIYRLLETKGPSGDPGYVIAKNNKLMALLKDLA